MTLYRWTLPAINILLYNVVGGSDGTGDLLYGEEPASYYVVNLFLNLNVVSLLAAILPPLALLKTIAASDTPSRNRLLFQLLYLLPAYLWLGVMFTRPHKEERFLYPIYPLLCLAAAQTVWQWKETTAGLVARYANGKAGASLLGLVRLCAWGLMGLHAVLATSRVVSMAKNYTAPLHLYRHLYHSIDPPSRVCVGGEWYRFPSSFFLPNEGAALSFIKSSFGGQLPQPFRPVNGTWDTPLQPFNELNKEEPSRYVPLGSCDYFVELLPDGATDEAITKALTKNGEFRPSNWQVVDTWPFLNVDASRSPFRALYIPHFTPRYVSYGAYTLLGKKRGKR